MQINLSKIYEENKSSIIEIGLISHQGEIVEFISKNDKKLDEKNRIISSILASVSLSSRASSTLANQKIKKIFLKGESSFVSIYILQNHYLYLNTTIKEIRNINEILQLL